MTDRPFPPDRLCETRDPGEFRPGRALLDFMREAFILEGAPFHRHEYAHLAEAKIGALWTNVERVKDGMLTLGMAQLFRNSGDKWTSGRSTQQVLEWFGGWWPDDVDLRPLPDFIVTIYAPTAAEMSDATFCALLAHELRHCGQKIDRYGEPKYDNDGNPMWAMVGHDVEQFVSVVEDFGIEAAGPAAVRLVKAAKRAPRFSAGEVAGVCGCGARLQAVA